MLYKTILFTLLYFTTCEGFYNVNISSIHPRLNLTCYYYGLVYTDCEYCVYQFFNNGSASEVYYDCSQVTNTYKTISQRCQGFSDTTDIGYGVCLPLSFELFDISILCICATNMCNQNFTSCQSSVNYQIESNSAPSVLPSVAPAFTTPISCVDTTNLLGDSSTMSSFCAEYSSPYINVTECNEYVVNNTVLCIYISSGGNPYPFASTSDDYNLFLSGAIIGINERSQDPNIVQFYNESSSYFYVNWNETFDDNTTLIVQRCLCAEDNCNSNLMICLNANRLIVIENNARSKLFKDSAHMNICFFV
jgi:hypothetical protein